MRKILYIVMSVAILCGLVVAWNVAAQSGGKEADAGSSADEKGTAQKERTYIPVGLGEIQRSPERFEKHFIKLADYFGRKVTQFPRSLRKYRITPDRYFGFTTHRVVGSNMLCFIERDNKEAAQILDTLLRESRVYLMGQVGPRIESETGAVTLFVVDRMARGHQEPVAQKKKGPVILILEWDATTPTGIKRYKKKYEISLPHKRYELKDPYSGKMLYVTLEY